MLWKSFVFFRNPVLNLILKILYFFYNFWLLSQLVIFSLRVAIGHCIIGRLQWRPNRMLRMCDCSMVLCLTSHVSCILHLAAISPLTLHLTAEHSGRQIPPDRFWPPHTFGSTGTGRQKPIAVGFCWLLANLLGLKLQEEWCGVWLRRRASSVTNESENLWP